VTSFKDVPRSSVAHPKRDPRVNAIALLMALAEADPTVTGATLIMPDGSAEFLDATRLREGGQA
jgi:hypothetical protein